MLSRQFVTFLIVGGFSAIVNIVSRIVFNLYFSFIISIFIAFFIALTTAFFLNKYFVFEKSSHKNWMIEYWYFFLVNILGLIQTVGISLILVKYIFVEFNYTFYPELCAHSIGVVIPIFTSFIGHKYFSFKVE